MTLRQTNWVTCRRTGIPGEKLIGPHGARDAALALIDQLYDVRNAFLHGNSVTANDLRVGHSGRHIFRVAAPLYRLLLTCFLTIEPKPNSSDDAQALADFIVHSMEANREQREAEQAITDAHKAKNEQDDDE